MLTEGASRYLPCEITPQQRPDGGWAAPASLWDGGQAWGPAHRDSRALGHHGEAQHAQPRLGCAQATSRASYTSQPLLGPGKGSQSPDTATGHHL